jgi:hypothetical protein
MQELLDWTIRTIRNDDIISSGLEEKKYNWVPLASVVVNKIINHEYSVIVVTDTKREWFGEYIMSKINSNRSRPYLPFYDFKNYTKTIDSNSVNSIKDILHHSFGDNYLIWYIGAGNHPRALLPKTTKGSFMWITDEEIQNSFYIQEDAKVDIKFLELFRLFDKTLEAVMFSEVELED